MNGVTGGAAITNRVVFEDKRSSLFLVTAKACLVVAKQHGAAGRSNIIAMHVVTIQAGHSPFRDRVVVLEHEFTLDIKVAGKARSDI